MEEVDVSVVVVYVPAGSRRNFQIGLAKSVWGWKPDTAGRADTPQVLASLKPGDYLLLGHRGPNARVPAGGWTDAVLQELVVARATSNRYHAENTVWPDDTYDVRIDLEILGVEKAVAGHQLGEEAMEAFRLSANKQGAPVPVHDPAVLDRLVDSVQEQSAGEDGSQTPPSSTPDDVDPQERYLDLPENLDRPTLALARREQAGLRRAKFRGKPIVRCDLCGRMLPAILVRAAHVKKRSQCNLQERSDLWNLMGACVLGCDALFEDGFIYVTFDGSVEMSPKAEASEDLASVAKVLKGRTCTAHHGESEQYFAWHRTNVASAAPTGTTAVDGVTV
ncbi:hypothetical protein [Kitasatospora sp. NPDC088779]|uniref:hypothetical protein n=1 Tax=Kitasatospora sp. NPDC088779 TaxID=3154964 RepID=UPI003412B6A7